MKVTLQFKWYDLWIGFFWDKKTRTLYFCPLPTEARKIIYESYKVLAGMLQKDYPDSKLYRQYNLKDA